MNTADLLRKEMATNCLSQKKNLSAKLLRALETMAIMASIGADIRPRICESLVAIAYISLWIGLERRGLESKEKSQFTEYQTTMHLSNYESLDCTRLRGACSL